MKITFHGAAREVTGSFHLLEVDGYRIAVDCGLFQGRRKESDSKNRNFPVKPSEIDSLILTHAHIDHTGRVPMLVKNGFDGDIHSTSATRDLCSLMLADSAHIQQEDARYLTKKNEKRGNGEPPVEPLYTDHDVRDALRLFRTTDLKRRIQITPTISAEFHEAGHMLGSAGVCITVERSSGPVRIVFSGDVGRPNSAILRDPAPLPECDVLVHESTYGGRTTEKNTDLKESLARIVTDTAGRGGKVVIPAFSVGRTQQIVYRLHQLMHENRLPDIPIYIDSPLAVNATEVFRMHPECYDDQASSFERSTGDILCMECCTYIRSVDESKAINSHDDPAVIISASGMCEAGRILHHLKNSVGNSKNTILIVGFQAEHTLGRRIVDREKKLRIFNEYHQLKAQVEVLNGFSAHADRDEMRARLKPRATGVKQSFLVHGEEDQMAAMTRWMKEDGFRNIVTPEQHSSHEIVV